MSILKITGFSALIAALSIAPDAMKLQATLASLHGSTAVQQALAAKPHLQEAASRISGEVRGVEDGFNMILHGSFFQRLVSVAQEPARVETFLADVAAVWLDPEIVASVQSDTTLGPLALQLSAEIRSLENDASALGLKLPDIKIPTA